MDFSLSLLSLLHFSPVIDEIKLLSPEILYEVNASGHSNLEGIGKTDTSAPKAPEPSAAPSASEAKAPELPVALLLKSFVIMDGKVRYLDASSGREISMGSIQQKASLDLDLQLQDVLSKGLLEINEISVKDSASALRKGGIRVSISHDIRLDLPGENLRLNKIEMSFQDIHVSIDGSVSHFKTKPVLDLNISAPSISLASVLKEVPAALSPDVPKLKAEGTASLQAHIQGALDTGSMPEVDATFKISGGAVHHADLPLGVEHLEMDAALHGESLNLTKLTFDMGQNPVRVEVLVSQLRDKIPQLEKLSVDAVLDLGGLAALAQRMGMLDKDIHLAGMETIKLQASGPMDAANPQKLSATGTVDLKNVSLSLPEKPSMTFTGHVDIANERIREQLAAKIGKSDVTVNGDVTNYLPLVLQKKISGFRTRVKLDVRSGILDLDELLPKPSPEDTVETAAVTPVITEYPPPPPVDGDITVTLGSTRLMGLEMTQFQMQTSLRPGEVKSDLKGNLYSGGFSSSVRAAVQNSKDMNVFFKANVNHVEANDFISRLNDRVPLKSRLFKSIARQSDNLIYGKLNLNADLTTHGLPHQFANNLSGTVLAALTDGKIMESGLTKNLSSALSKVNSSLGFKELAFSELKADLKVENGNLWVRDFHVQASALGGAQASGKIGFDNALDLNLTQSLPPGVSKMVGGATGALTGQLAKLASVPQLANASLVPMDKSGHALLYYLVGGTLTQPTFSLDAGRMAKEGTGNAKSALEDALRQKQNELKARAEAEKQKLEAEARARIEAEKKKAVDKAKTEGANQVKQQGKKLLKNIGL